MSKLPEAPNDKLTETPVSQATPAPKAKEKKKLTLDISDVSEVLERKISP